MHPIPRVTAADFCRVEGKTSEMGYLVLEERFRSVFPGMSYAEPWDTVRRRFKIYPNAVDAQGWADGVNNVIDILNGLGPNATASDIRQAFGI